MERSTARTGRTHRHPPPSVGQRVAGGLALMSLAAGVVACGPAPGPPAADGGPTSAVDAASELPTGYGAPVLLGVLSDDAVTESSGLVASRRNPGLLWTHNDSGGGPLLYCFDLHGRACGVWRVDGAGARDWEDLAAGPGPRAGHPNLFVGDIGDNDGSRPHVVVYRLPEPAVSGDQAPSSGRQPLATASAQALRLRYPDGPHDAETVLVHPGTGDLYLVTKEPSGVAGVYRAPAALDPATTGVLTLVAQLRLPAPPGSPPPAVTGGDIAPDGRRVALSTYVDAYELTLPPEAGFDSIWQQPPVAVSLALRQQGEAIAYRGDGQALLTTSEGLPAPLHEVARHQLGKPATDR